MLDNHSDKGDSNWQIFAECVRLAMARQGNFYVSHRPIREKLAYEEFMYGYKPTLELDGKTYVYHTSSTKSSDDNFIGIEANAGSNNLLEDTEAQQ